MSGTPSADGGGAREVADLELVEDRTASSRCDEGFLRLRRLRMRTVYADGSRSEPYPVDVVSRREPDAVAVAVYAFRGEGAEREALAVLRRGVRPPVHLRRQKALVQPDAAPRSTLLETVAGILEPEDRGPRGVARRAAAEALEEAGVPAEPAGVEALGAPSFPSPGVTDEKVHFRAVRADLARVGAPAGDGSAMEEGGGVEVVPLREAIARCRAGDIPDLKTEVALLRLADRLGYVAGLDAWVDDLPEALRSRWSPLGADAEGSS